MGRLWARQQAGLPLCSLARPQASGRLRAHYHCVVCSVTIARKTDMVSHLKRHVNRGETEATYSAGSGLRREEPGERAAPFDPGLPFGPQQFGPPPPPLQLRQVRCVKS